MINNTPFWYAFIKACVWFLHYITPVSIIYTLIATLYNGLQNIHHPILIGITSLAIAETLFYVAVFLPYRSYFQRDTIHPETLSRAQRKALFEKCNAHITNPSTYLSKWFLGADLADIKRDNVADFILWAFFNRHGPAGDDAEEVEEYIQLHERTFGHTFPPGRGNVGCLRLTLEKVDMLHRSLVWYFCVGFVDFLTYVNLSIQRFRQFHPRPETLVKLFPPRPYALTSGHTSPVKTSYWHRPHKSKTHLPILFIHGIGVGLYPYTNFLREINKGLPSYEEIGVIALEIMPVSFRLSPAPLSASELSKEISKILEYHGYDRVVLAVHSYGSVIGTHLLHDRVMNSKIADILLIDPVSVLLHLPDVAYNFVRRKPRTAAEWQLWYFASMDLGVARALGRYFFWSENIVWKEDLDLDNRRVTVSLAGRDLIVDTEAVGRYLVSEDGDTPARRRVKMWEREAISQDSSDLDDEHEDLDSDDDRAKLVEENWKHRHWRGEGLEVLWFDHLDHAQVFDKEVTRERLVNVLRTYCRIEEIGGFDGGDETRVMNGNGNEHRRVNGRTNGHLKSS